jgi:hypothetical protein
VLFDFVFCDIHRAHYSLLLLKSFIIQVHILHILKLSHQGVFVSSVGTVTVAGTLVVVESLNAYHTQHHSPLNDPCPCDNIKSSAVTFSCNPTSVM